MTSWYQSLSSRSRQIGSHVWQPRNTSSIIFSKGLLNAPGENNCFLNSAVQVLWHLDVFRRSFREMGGHACMGKACIFCALKVLFTQLRYSERQSLPPDALRKALAVAFADEHRFQLGCMDDAAECFENILTRIHFHLAHDIKEDLCDAKHCISHRKFAMTLIEHCVCTCGATSEPFPFTQMVHYVSCTALCNEAAKLKEKYRYSNSVYFGQVLRNAGAIGDIRDCPSECGKKINIRRVLMNCPDVVAIGLVWDSDRPDKDHIIDVIQCLGTSLRMPDLFNSVVDDKAKQAALHLVGVVTYYGKHYSTFFYNTTLRLWVYFDDATVKHVGPNWRDVVNRCMRGHSQPLLLLFANPNGTPVSTETAPTKTALLPGYEELKSPTAAKPRETLRFRDDRSSIPNSIQSQSLQPVVEYEPEPDGSFTSGSSRKALERHVVEIGHDALQTVGVRQKGGQSGIQDRPRVHNSSPSKDYSRYSTTGGLDKNQIADRLRPPVQHARGSTAVNTTPLQLRSLDVASAETNEDRYSIKGSTFAEDFRNGHSLSKENDKTRGNMPPPAPRNRQLHGVTASQPGSRQNREFSHGHVNADLDRATVSRRLERHESWSGSPNEARAVPLKHNAERSTVHRHSSFSQGEFSSLQPQSVHNTVQNPEREYSQSLSYRSPYMRMRKSSSMVEYTPKQETSLQFGSVPNLSRGFDYKTGKSASMQNIAMADEGILANAIKNKIQLKRASTSSSSTDGRSSCVNDFTSLPNPTGRESINKFSQESNQTTHSNSGRNVDGYQSVNHKTTRDKRTHSWSPKNDSQLGPHTQLGKNERDSVASRDSGYRSRDRSSASSGSVHSFETRPDGGHHNQVETRSTSNQDSQLNNKPSRSAADIEAFCEHVCSECANLQALSKVKGEAGDLATALALCTAAVTKLKKCLKLNGVSAQRCKVLHSQYNGAVLQSRNLHRRLTLLRRQDSFFDQDNISFDTQSQHESDSPLYQPAQDSDLISFHGSSIEGNRVDRLKQQLQELYLQAPDTKQTNIFRPRQDHRPSTAIPRTTITPPGDLKETLKWQDMNRRSSNDKDTNVLLARPNGSPTLTSPNKSAIMYGSADLQMSNSHAGDFNSEWQGQKRSPTPREINSLHNRQEGNRTPTLSRTKSPTCLNSPVSVMSNTNQEDPRGTLGWQGINRNQNAYTGTGWFPDSHVQSSPLQGGRGPVRADRHDDGLHDDMNGSLSSAKIQSQYTNVKTPNQEFTAHMSEDCLQPEAMTVPSLVVALAEKGPTTSTSSPQRPQNGMAESAQHPLNVTASSSHLYSSQHHHQLNQITASTSAWGNQPLPQNEIAESTQHPLNMTAAAGYPYSSQQSHPLNRITVSTNQPNPNYGMVESTQHPLNMTTASAGHVYSSQQPHPLNRTTVSTPCQNQPYQPTRAAMPIPSYTNYQHPLNHMTPTGPPVSNIFPVQGNSAPNPHVYQANSAMVLRGGQKSLCTEVPQGVAEIPYKPYYLI